MRTLSVLVENKPGVLTRISGLFARRGYNIDSLAVGKLDDLRFSRMTIVVDESVETVEQVSKQLNKLIDVIKLTDITDEQHIERELVLIKINCKEDQRRNILDLCDIFRGKVVDLSKESVIVESTGSSSKVDAILEAFKPFGILDIVRTGKIGITRGKGR